LLMHLALFLIVGAFQLAVSFRPSCRPLSESRWMQSDPELKQELGDACTKRLGPPLASVLGKKIFVYDPGGEFNLDAMTDPEQLWSDRYHYQHVAHCVDT
jgi:hypothetical protein